MAKFIAEYKCKIREGGIQKIIKQTHEISSGRKPSNADATAAVKRYISWLNDAIGSQTYQFVELVKVRETNALDSIKKIFNKK